MKDKKEDDQKRLVSLRTEIDELDQQLIDLLAERRAKSLAAAEVKYAEHSPIRDQHREEKLLSLRLQHGRERKLDGHFVSRIFHEIIDDSIRYQQQFLQRKLNSKTGEEVEIQRIGFQGSKGSFSHLAAEQYFSRVGVPVTFNGCTSYRLVVEMVERGDFDLGVLPIENTTSGGINEVYDLLQKTRLVIVGEEKYRITPCLLGLSGTKQSNIRRVYSHPQLALQCGRFLSDLDVPIETSFNTNETVEELRRTNAKDSVVIASEEAAELLGLDIVKRGIADQTDNFTRFLIVARQPIRIDERVPCKTSVVLATANKPGALVDALKVFQDNKVNLTKLESRPVLGNPWEEMFYLDFEGNAESDHIRFVIEEVRRHSRFLKVLGCYPSSDIIKTEVAPHGKTPTDGASIPHIPREKARVSTKEEGARSKTDNAKLYSRDYKLEDSVIDVRGVRIGGDSFVIIGGPCSVETEEQIFQCAKHLKETGGHVLRGGCFKPRTSPYSFQGLGYAGLELLVQAGRTYDLPVVTEVLAVEDVHKVAEKSDIIQIGARNMQNFTLLQEVGRTQRPVMLKRGMSSSIDDLLNASEYILSQGNQQVFFCERGIRTFENATRNTLDLSAIPVIRQKSHLPVIVDPSHAAGTRDLIVPLVYASRAVGAHGVMVEFHPNPDEALSDGPQALLFEQWAQMMEQLR
ncbi:3-deoxy-7-phosphoheptulonate synthase [bacterium]|nr:3-deoxy-7-phosphoheptulonate synthase [bacterium]